ncbi:MAG: MlaD family protein [Nocardioidaceae bacterium]|nr:MlaD family protein [Nocardioidaceae bacterium]
MNALRSPFAIGAILLGLFGAAILFGLNAVHGMPLVKRAEVKVAFDDLSGLNNGDDVRIAGKRVGYVQDLRIEDDQAVAVLKIDDPDTKFYEDAKAARVSDRSGLGQKFVNLNPGDKSTGPLREGATIPASETVKTEDINAVLDVFDPKTRKNTQTTLQNLGGGMIGKADDLQSFSTAAPEILRNTGTVAQALSTDQGVPLGDMLESADRISARLATSDDELAALVDELAVTVDSLGVDEGNQVRASLDLAPGTLDAANSALRTLDAPLKDLAVAMRDMRPGAKSLGEATPDLRALLREGVKPLKKLPGVNKVAKPGVKALDRVVTDARPLAHQSIKAGNEGAPLATELGRYSNDIAEYYRRAVEILNGNTSQGNSFRFLIMPTLAEDIGLNVGVDRKLYPEPGEEW